MEKNKINFIENQYFIISADFLFIPLFIVCKIINKRKRCLCVWKYRFSYVKTNDIISIKVQYYTLIERGEYIENR